MSYYTRDRKMPPMADADRGEILTHAEIAQRLGISRARVGQIEQLALIKLRALAEKEGISLADFFSRPGDC